VLSVIVLLCAVIAIAGAIVSGVAMSAPFAVRTSPHPRSVSILKSDFDKSFRERAAVNARYQQHTP